MTTPIFYSAEAVEEGLCYQIQNYYSYRFY